MTCNNIMADDLNEFKPNDSAVSWYNAYADRLNSNYATMELQQELFRDPLFKRLHNEVILQNKHLFKDKIVLEVDCGLGVLSVVVSKYAKKVIAVEASYLAESLLKIIAANKIENIEVIKQHIDDVELLPEGVDKVDIIMSQYMGYLLFDRKLLSRLLKARDKFLKPEGIMVPHCLELIITGINYGHSTKIEREAYFKSGQVKEEIVPKNKIQTNAYRLRKIDLKTFCIDNYNFTRQFLVTAETSCFVDAFVFYFEIKFSKCHKEVSLSNAPWREPTRWKQMVFPLVECVQANQSDSIEGEFVFRGACEHETMPRLILKLSVRHVRSKADYERIRQQNEARQKPFQKILKHPSRRRFVC